MNPKAIALGWACLWIAAVTPAMAAQPDRLKQIEASKTLRVCIWPDYYLSLIHI